MRFLFCLPMLLLAFALHAQNDCHLSNLSATVSGPDPITCQYFVTLQFDHVGTTNQFKVQGNGIIYGTFPYSVSPLVLGPFTAGAAATSREFVVRDAVFGDCQASIEVSIPGCSAPACNIQQHLVAEAGECNTDSTYQLFLNFTPTSAASSDSFTVFANGQYFGHYAVSQLPLQIAHFPWDGGAFDVVRVCLDATAADACCGEIEFHVPPCFPYSPCELSQLHINAGECTSDSTFRVVLDFEVATPAVADSFELWASGQYLGQFSINQLPLTIPNFPWNEQIFSTIKVCTGNTVGCCREKQFLAPACLPFGPCEISNISAIPGPCNQDDTYKLTVNFQGTNPGNGKFTLYANSQVLGIYPLTALPLTLPNFPASGNPVEVLKICINDVPGTVACCKNKEFAAPNCASNDSCGILALALQVGECSSDSTYQLVIDFETPILSANGFQVWANGQLLGSYTLGQLPLTIPNFPWHGGNYDALKICLLNLWGASLCCRTLEIEVPDCLQNDCDVYDVVVDAGACNPAGGYSLVLDFEVEHPGNDFFEVWAGNGQYVGIFPLSMLPLTIPNFPGSGNAVGIIKICINDQPNCCKTEDFLAPNCNPNDCEIHELTVETGECHGDSAYQVTVNFQVAGSTATSFQLWANGQVFGTYMLSQLPLTIPNFPWNGGNHDVLKVCVLTNTISNNCCKTLEYAVPECLEGSDCEIYNLVVDAGDCDSTHNTYSLVVNFQVENPGNASFEIWAGNGQYLGVFPLTALPLTIPNFPWGGGAVDLIKICINDHPDCCKTKEFEAPTCFGNDCEIHALTVETGECQGDSTYQVSLNFQVANPPVNSFSVFANGELYGSFLISQLPLTIPHFPWNGGNHDVIKVCFGTAGALICCKTLEFAVPECLMEDCHLADVHAVATPCLCGQFFALVTFDHQSGGSGGFDIVGNGHHYGTFPYGTPQPIIVGPLVGDNSTMYEFGVQDHLHPDCHDGTLLGKVECPTLTTGTPTTDATLLLAPNPVSNWLTVTALLTGGARMGQSTAQVYHTDGRLVLTQSVEDGGSFQLEVSALPAGVYRLAVRSDVGTLEGTFSKL